MRISLQFSVFSFQSPVRRFSCFEHRTGYWKLKTENLLLLFAFCLSAFAICHFPFSSAPIRLAIIDLQGDERGEIAALLRLLARDNSSSSFEIVDEDLTRAAVSGSGHAGSLNMSRDEARALGQSLGCDYYILGKVLLTRRVASGEQYYYEALAGLFFVEARTGRLIKFAFEQARKQNQQDAYRELKESIKNGWKQYAEEITSAQKSHSGEIERAPQVSIPVIDIINDGAEAQTIQRPVFYQRLKPVYTEQAELAGITATVELDVVFGEDGRVGNVEIVRWAGFGLDESSIATVRLIKYKPAEGEGKRLTIRGLVRYNFKRPLSQAAPPQAQSQEEIERLKQSLRGILAPGQKPERNPDF